MYIFQREVLQVWVRIKYPFTEPGQQGKTAKAFPAAFVLLSTKGPGGQSSGGKLEAAMATWGVGHTRGQGRRE